MYPQGEDMTTDSNPKPIKSKKSETLEVRIPYETKQAFLTACREDGTTASEVVRESVQTYLDGRERPVLQEKRSIVMKFPALVRHYAPRIAAGGIAALGLATFAALPSAAAPDFKAQFTRLDANGDGVLSADEFLGPKDAGAGKQRGDIVIETRKVVRNGDDGAAPKRASPELKQEAFAFALPEGVSDDKAGQHQAFNIMTRRESRELKDGEPALKEDTLTFSIGEFRKQEFDTIDADKDGKVSLAEYQSHQRALFTRGFEMLDANSDKSLSADEYAKIVAPPMIRLNDDPDAPPEVHIDGGPKISPEALKAAFTRLDANKDGILSLQEYLPQT